jgi:hypothetical protein
LQKKILGSMAQRGWEKIQILPLLHDPHTLHKLHYEARRWVGKHHAKSPRNNARDEIILQGSSLRTPCGPHSNNRAGDPKYSKPYLTRTKCGSHETHNASIGGPSHSRSSQRKRSKIRWFHYRLLPLLLANAQGRGVVVGGGIT